MPIEPRDERFLEFAVASRHLDGVAARRLHDLRAVDACSEAIEQFAVRHGFLSPEAVRAVIAFARETVTQVESMEVPSPTVADTASQAKVMNLDDTVKDDPMKAAAGRLGARFGPYAILGDVGRGGMGAVYQARKDGTQEVVALKVLSDEKNPNPATVRRFDREIRAGREIDHPNVVKVFDAGEVEGRLFFTMELIDGRTFDKVFDELALREKVEIFEKIARAVHQAHSRGYLHRDLKPQNILITNKEREPKVCDFGLAKSLDRESRLTKTGAIIGTIAYMSPEQAEGGGMHKLDARTDIYSLGAILYQIICGTVPFKASTQYGTIGLILTTDPDPPVSVDPSCPPALSAIALKALEKEPEKRFPTAAALADEVARWLHGTKVTTQAPSLGGRLAKAVKRRRLPLAATLLTLAVAGGTVALLAWKRQREHRAHVDEATAQVEAILAEVAKPGATAELADRLDVLDAKLATLPELAARRSAIHGLAIAARSLEREKKVEEARPALEAALAAAPLRWDVRRACATVLERAGEPALAALCIEQASEKDASVFERLGLARLATGDLAAARAAFEQAGERGKPLLARVLALQGDPRALDAARALPASDEQALVLQEARLATEPGQAIDALRVIERSRKTPEIRLRIAQVLLRAERGAEALAELRRARGDKGTGAAFSVECLAAQAEAELLEGRPLEAARSLDEAAKLLPRGSFARARLLARKARIQLLAGQEPSRDALAERPDDPLVRIVFAGEDAALLEKLATELGTHPEAVHAWSALAALRAKKGDAAGASAATEKALAIAPMDEEALARDPSKARAAFAAGKGDAPRLLRASLVAWRQALGFSRDDDKARSETLLACAERAAPWAGSVALERGRRLLLQGEASRAAAREVLERGVALTPDDAAGLVLLASVSEPARALELANRALALEPENARALALRGKAQLDQKHADLALADLERALRIDRRDADAWAWKVAALEALGKPSPDAAREARERREALRVAHEALAAKDYPRAYDFAPEAPDIMKAVIDASFRGDVSSVADPVLLYSRIIALDPADYLRGIFDREAANSLQPSLADARDGADADADELFEAFVLRCVGIVRAKDTRPETLAKARLDLERCLAKDPAKLVAVGARGFVLALERQTDLADDDLKRVAPYIQGRVNVFVFAEALVKSQRGEPCDELVGFLDNRLDRDTLHPWVLELVRGAR